MKLQGEEAANYIMGLMQGQQLQSPEVRWLRDLWVLFCRAMSGQEIEIDIPKYQAPTIVGAVEVAPGVVISRAPEQMGGQSDPRFGHEVAPGVKIFPPSQQQPAESGNALVQVPKSTLEAIAAVNRRAIRPERFETPDGGTVEIIPPSEPPPLPPVDVPDNGGENA